MHERTILTTRAGILLTAIAVAACGSPRAQASSAPGVHYQGGSTPPGKALVLYGTRAGSTAEVADFVGRRLSQAGWEVDVEPVEAVKGLGGYGAVVIGSAVRKGSVLPEIRDFVKARRAELQKVPVAYFVVCLTMREDTPENRARAAAYLDPLRAEVKPLETGLFAGKVDPATLHGGAKMMARMANLPTGDFRDWAAIGEWADGLAARLATATAP